MSAAGLGLALGLLCAGLCVGGLLNLTIHRLPLMLRRQWRREAAAHDEAPNADGAKAASKPPARFDLLKIDPRQPPIKPIDILPVIGWLRLRGPCAEPTSLRRPLVEALSAAAALWAAAAFGPTWLALAAAVYAWALIALAGIDWETRLLPNQITLPLMWMGLLVNLDNSLTPLEGAIIGAAAGYLSLWSLHWAFKLAAGREGMGYGDFKLLAAIGAWLGWQALPPVLLLAAAACLLHSMTTTLTGRRARGALIPFGPFLAASGWAALIWREQAAAPMGG